MVVLDRELVWFTRNLESDPIQVYFSSSLSISENVVQNSFRVLFDLELSEAFDRGQLPGKMATREE